MIILWRTIIFFVLDFYLDILKYLLIKQIVLFLLIVYSSYYFVLHILKFI